MKLTHFYRTVPLWAYSWLFVLTCMCPYVSSMEFFSRFLGRLVFICKFSYSFLRFIHIKNMKAKGLYHVFCIKYMVEAIPIR